MARLQGGTNGSASTTTNTIVFAAATVGSLFTVLTRHALGTITSVTDDRGNSYIRDVNGISSSNRKVTIHHAVNITNLAPTITVTNDTSGGMTSSAQESSGYPSAVLDQTANATGTSTTPSTGVTPTRTAAAELLVGIMAPSGGTTSLGTNVAWAQSGSENQAEYFEAIAAGTDAATWTLSASNEWVCAIATYKAAARHVKPDIVKLQAVKRSAVRPRTTAALFRRRPGSVTRNAPIRGPKVLLQAVQRAERRPRVLAFLGRRPRLAAVVAAVFPRAVRVARPLALRRVAPRSFFLRKPRVGAVVAAVFPKRIRVLLQAVASGRL